MASGSFRVGIGQMDCTVGDVEANLETIETFAKQAADASCDIVVYPELSLSGYSVGRKFTDASIRPGSPVVDKLRKLSKKVALVVGFIEETEDTEFYNSAMFLANGRVQHVHRKVYLPNYRIFDERRYYGPGLGVYAFNAPWCRMAILICGDAWHLSMPYLAVHDGADVLIVIAASSDQGLSPDVDVRESWKRLNQTYALSLNSFVVFSNRVGREMLGLADEKLDFWGGSHVCDPSGKVIDQAGFGQPELLVSDVDLDQLRHQRLVLPFRRDDSLAFTLNVGKRVIHSKARRRHGFYGLVDESHAPGDPEAYEPTPSPRTPPDQSVH